MKKLIIIPAYNEAENLVSLIAEIKNKAWEYDYVIINDGSTDNTRNVCQDNGFNTINLPVNLGIGGAVQTGYLYALVGGYDVAIQLDGDGQHDPGYLDALIRPIIEGVADLCIGSRFIENQGFQSSFTRRMGISWLNTMLRIVAHQKITDSTSGFRAANKKVIVYFASNYPYDYPEPETISDASRKSFRIVEIPVVMRERATGTSSIKLYKTIYYMTKVTMAILISRMKRG